MVQEVLLEHRLEAFNLSELKQIFFFFFAQNFGMYKVGLMGWLSCRLFLFLFINISCVK